MKLRLTPAPTLFTRRFEAQLHWCSGPDTSVEATATVDVAVLFDAPPSPTLSGPRLVIEGRLERALGAPVDLVVLNDAPVDLRARVLRDGALLIDRDRSARIGSRFAPGMKRSLSNRCWPATGRDESASRLEGIGMTDPALLEEAGAHRDLCLRFELMKRSTLIALAR